WARFIGSAEERVAGSSTSSNSSIARTAPIPPSVIVSPTSACRSAALRAVVLGSVATVVWEAAHSSARLTASRSSPQTGEGCGAAAGHRRRRRRHGARGMRRRDGRGDARAPGSRPEWSHAGGRRGSGTLERPAPLTAGGPLAYRGGSDREEPG